MRNVTAIELARVRRDIRQHVERGGPIVHPSDAALVEAGVQQIDVVQMLCKCAVVDGDGRLYGMEGQVDGVERELMVWVDRCEHGNIVRVYVMKIWR